MKTPVDEYSDQYSICFRSRLRNRWRSRRSGVTWS